MTVKVLNSSEEVDSLAAEAILEQIESKADSVIGLSTGRTTVDIHKAFVGLCRKKRPGLSGITFFGIDEITNIPRGYYGSCYTMLKTQVIEPLGIKDSNFLMLPTRSQNYPLDCLEFVEELDRRGGIDFILLGLGENAHLGFNQPGYAFGSGCRVSDLYPELEKRVRRETSAPSDAVIRGATIGLADILSSRKLVLSAKGESKARAVKALIEEVPSEDVPASILQFHADATILLDRDAASLLREQSKHD